MAVGDNRRTIQVADLDLQKVNTALAQICDWVTRLEGRSGTINLRDSVVIQSDKQTLIDFESSNAGKASIAVFGTENATLAFAKGARKENNGDWIATDTVAVIWALDRAGNGTLYVNTGLVDGQAFTPTISFVLGTGGSVTPHVLDSSTHTISGKTAGHVLQATAATTFGFAALTGLNVTNTAAGNIVATTVQAAINELDTEKVAKAGDTMSGLLTWGANNPNPAIRVRHVEGKEGASANADTLYLNYSAAAKGVVIGDSGTDHPLTVNGEIIALGKVTFSNDTYFYNLLVSSNPLMSVDNNDYFQYIRSNNTFQWVIGAAQAFGFDAAGFGLFNCGQANPAGYTAGTVVTGLTAPSLYHYAKPIAGRWTAGTGSAITLTGAQANVALFDANAFNTATGKLALQTVASVANAAVTLVEAGQYRISLHLFQNIANNAGATVYLQRFNSSNTLQEYTWIQSQTNVTGSTRDFGFSGTALTNAAANDYIIATYSGTIGGDDNWNVLCIERLN